MLGSSEWTARSHLRAITLPADHDALAADGAAGTAVLLVAVLGLGAAGVGRLGDVAAAAAAAVQLDAVALAGDAVAITVALSGRVAHGGQGRGRGRAGGARRQGRADGAGRAVGVGVLVRQTGASETTGEVVDGRGELGLAELARGVGLGRLGVLDLGGRQSAASGDVGRGTAALAVRASAAGAGLATGDIEDVELAAGGGLDGVLDGRVVGDVVPIHDVVVPVAATELQHGGLEAELADPGTGLVLGRERQLARVVVPRADQVDGLDVGRGAQVELELNGGHYDGSEKRHGSNDIVVEFCVRVLRRDKQSKTTGA